MGRFSDGNAASILVGYFRSDIIEAGNNLDETQRYNIALKSKEEHEENLFYTYNEDYKNMGSIDLAGLFAPFRMKNDANSSLPYLAPSGSVGSGEIDTLKLLPFRYDNSSTTVDLNSSPGTNTDSIPGMISSSGYLGDTNKIRDTNDIRGIGLRLPMIAVGWGYDTDDNAVPSGTTPTKFKGEVNDGWAVDQKEYIAAPVDLRYDRERNVWAAGGTSQIKFARITAYQSSDKSYSWTKQVPNNLGGFQNSTTTGTLNAFEKSGFVGVEIGTIVELYKNGTKNGQPLYVFTFVDPKETFAVKLIQTGGSNGTAGSPATWTYRVENNDGHILGGTDSTPIAPLSLGWRLGNGPVIEATDGIASYNYLGTLTLQLALERHGNIPCAGN